MLAGMKKQKRWHGREEIRRILRQYHESDVSQAQFAAGIGVSLSTLARWLRMEGAAGGISGRQRASKGKQASLMEVALREPALRESVGGFDYEIAMREGDRLLIRGGFVLHELESVLEVLRRSGR
jgi:transposase-like protein